MFHLPSPRRLAKRFGALNLQPTIPPTPSVTQAVATDDNDMWTPGQWLRPSSGSSQEEGAESLDAVVPMYNEAMANLSAKTKVGNINPLTFQLKSTWDEATESDKQICIDRAIEGCSVVCNIIAPNAGERLLESCTQIPEHKSISEDLVSLMHAYKNAPTKNLKTQILSIYSYRFSVKKLQKLHEPYEHLTTWQVKRARAHAQNAGPGWTVEKSPSFRVRLDKVLVDHFVDFINRPYFYQDVAYGTRKIQLDSGEKRSMPNVIRTVTRSTMVKQYLQFCKEENVTSISRATLFRILQVREASQQKSLSGLDNTAADGSSGFEQMIKIVEELQQLGKDKKWCEATRKTIQEGKRYLKTGYRSHCQQSESSCADHCRKFSLSDPDNSELQERCTHDHTSTCSQCEGIKVCLINIEEAIEDKHVKMYSDEQRGDFLYDFKKAEKAINQWKNHIMRSANQERAKQDVLNQLDSSSKLLVMDWAMKFLQLRYREKQTDWYGKRGLSWHVTSVVSRDKVSGKISVSSYTHIFDQCTQDWYAVASIIEHLLLHLKQQDPQFEKAYLRSDEAGCYHNNCLIAAVKDIADRVGIKVMSYDYSEPQSGKDVCDRMICPMKNSIRTYANEGHDILTASDMRKSLQQHPVRGTSASVNNVDESKKDLVINNLDGYASFHNFQFKDDGIKVSKAYGIGNGKLIGYDKVYQQHQGPTTLITQEEGEGFFVPPQKAKCWDRKESALPSTEIPGQDEQVYLFECSFPGCSKVFREFSDLELHLNVDEHTTTKQESIYNKIKRDWVLKFASVDVVQEATTEDALVSTSAEKSKRNLEMGWAINKPTSGSKRFSPKIKEYLTRIFLLGEKTGRKADPEQVEKDMRNSRNTSDDRQFSRNEWLTKTQIKGFFSRLAAKQRKHHGLLAGFSSDNEEDVE